MKTSKREGKWNIIPSNLGHTGHVVSTEVTDGCHPSPPGLHAMNSHQPRLTRYKASTLALHQPGVHRKE